MDSLNLEKVVAIDPVVDVEETFHPKEVIARGGVNKSVFQMNADSWSDQVIVFNNITPPSLTTVVQRVLRLRYKIYITCVYTTAGAAYPATPYFPAVQANGTVYQLAVSGILRSFPLQSAASSIEVRINGAATSVSPNDHICMFPHILTDEEQRRFCSDFPCEKDDLALYVDAANNLRSPFKSYQQNTTVPSRGSYFGKLISSTAATPTANQTTDVYEFEVVEQLVVSPFTYGDGMQATGLANINNITLNIRIADINRALSVMPSALAGGNTVSATINNGAASFRPQLLLEYITQDPVLASRQPEQLIYNYELVQPFISPLPNQWVNNSAALTSFPSQSIRLASIPDKLFIFARPSKSSLSTAALAQNTPDTFLRITGLRINYNNRISIFGTYSESDLYKMSVRNGLKSSWHDWQYRTGSLAIIDITNDICLEPDQAAGMANQYSTLQVYADVSASPLAYAAQTQALNYDLYVVVSQNGKAAISKSECQFLLQGVNGDEVLAVSSNPAAKVDATDMQNQTKASGGSGGSLWGSIGKIATKGLHLLHHVKPHHLEMAREGLKHLGLHHGGAVAGGAVAGGAVAGGKMGKHKRVY
jgi:hypothetical protein